MNPTILNCNTQFTHAIHISDIHIPNNLVKHQRKQKYLETFDILYSSLRQNTSNFIIVITGDLFHDKAKITPETYVMAQNFLYNLCLIAPTVIISGNHDMNENNLDEICSIQAICNQITHQNLFYLKYSGLYQISNIHFVVSSLEDGKFIKYSDIDFELPPNTHLITLYHGLLTGSTSDLGHTYTETSSIMGTRQRTPKDFENFPLVMLGDIHKQQSLRPDHSMAYAGSLIQQHIGESFDNHGYLLWNLETKTYNFVEVRNSYGFIRVEITNGFIPDISNIKINNPIIVCSLKNTSPLQFDTIKQQINNLIHTVDIYLDTHTPMPKNGCDTLTPHIIKNVTLDFECSIIRDYKTKDPQDPILLYNEDLKSLHQQIYNSVPLEELTQHSWGILSLEFKNLFSYGNDRINRIDFSSGIHNLQAPNRQGKSSICNIILLGLFHKTSRDNFSTQDIINKRSTNGCLKLIINVDNHLYRIEKIISSGKRNIKSQTVIKVKLFQCDPNIDEINLTHEDSDETKKIIESFVGTFDNFLQNNTLLPKLLQSSILYDKPADALRNLQKLFQLNRFETYKNIANDKLKLIKSDGISVKTIIEDRKKQMAEIDFNATEQKLLSHQEELTRLCNNISLLNNNFKSQETTISDAHYHTNELLRQLKQINNSLILSEKVDLQKRFQLLCSDKIFKNSRPTLTSDTIKSQLSQYQIPSFALEYYLQQLQEKNKFVPSHSEEHVIQLLQQTQSAISTNKIKLEFLTKQIVTNVEQISDNRDLDELETQLNTLQSQHKHVHMSENSVLEKLKQINTYLSHHDISCFETIDALQQQLIENKSLELCLIEKNLNKDVYNPDEIYSYSDEQLIKMIDNLQSEINDLKNTKLIILPQKHPYTCKDYNACSIKLNKLKNTRLHLLSIANLPNYSGQSWIEHLENLEQSLDNFLISPVFRIQLINLLKSINSGQFIEIEKLNLQISNLTEQLVIISDVCKHNKIIQANQQKNTEIETLISQKCERSDQLQCYLTIHQIDDVRKKIHTISEAINQIQTYQTSLSEQQLLHQYLSFHQHNRSLSEEINKLITIIKYKKNRLIEKQCSELLSDTHKMETEFQTLMDIKIWYETIHEIKQCIETHHKISELQNQLSIIKKWELFDNIKSQLEQHDAIELNRFIQQQINAFQETISTTHPTLNENRKQLINLSSQRTGLEKDIQYLSSTLEKYNSLQSEFDNLCSTRSHSESQSLILKTYISIVSDNGILPSAILKEHLKYLQDETNQFFTRFTGYSLSLNLNEQNKIDMFVSSSTFDKLNLMRLSGAESCLLQVAFKSSCNKISPSGRSGLFIIDEVLDCLDPSNWDNSLPDIFHILRHDFINTLFISHRNIKPHLINHYVRIQKSNGNSYIY